MLLSTQVCRSTRASESPEITTQASLPSSVLFQPCGAILKTCRSIAPYCSLSSGSKIHPKLTFKSNTKSSTSAHLRHKNQHSPLKRILLAHPRKAALTKPMLPHLRIPPATMPNLTKNTEAYYRPSLQVGSSRTPN
jgi:hypothetical protein